MTDRFSDKLLDACQRKKSHLAVSLVPDVKKIPKFIKENAKALGVAFYAVNKAYIDALEGIIPAVVLPVADYEKYGIGGMVAFDATSKYAASKGLFVIVDGKFGGTEEDCEALGRAFLSVGQDGALKEDGVIIEGMFFADALTLSPYISADGIKKLVNLCEDKCKGLFINAVNTDTASEDEFENIITKETEVELYNAALLDVGFFGKNYVGTSGYSILGAQVIPTQKAIEVRNVNEWSIILVDATKSEHFDTTNLSDYFNDDDSNGALVYVSDRVLYAYETPEYKDTEENFAAAAAKAAAALSYKLEDAIC